MADLDQYDTDEIDEEILRILTEDPRMPYADISEELERAGYELSSEAVRQRVVRLFEEPKLFFLSGPTNHSGEVCRLYVSVRGGSRTLERVYDAMSDMEFWLLCKGIGMVNIHAVATVSSTVAVEKLYHDVQGIDGVTSVSFFIETERRSWIENYF